MWNTLFVTVHACAATVAFVAGLRAMPDGRLLELHRAALAVMVLALVPALGVGWSSTEPVARAVFAGLLVLAAVMVVRAELAARVRPSTTGGPTVAYLAHVGFVLIALADGFAVVTAVRLGLPGWAVGTVAVGIVACGHVGLGAAQRRLTARPVPV